MITSHFLKRNFLNQTGDFDFNWNISTNNVTGEVEFGVSGNKKYFYKLKSGEIYDAYNNILGSYVSGEIINLRNIIVNKKDTLYFNNEIQFYHKPTEIFFDNHNYNYFFVNPKNCIVDFSFSLNGEDADLLIQAQNKRYRNENTDQDIQIITGRIYNSKPNLDIKIFNINIIGNFNYELYNTYFPLNFNNYIDIYFKPTSGDINYSNKNIALNLDTNFGSLSTAIQITGEFIPLQFENFSVSPSSPEILFTSNKFQDFNIIHGGNGESVLKFIIEYKSGTTGDITGYISGTGYYESYITGYVSGSGYVSKNLENSTIISGYNTYTKRMEYDIFPGNSIEVKKFVYATGNVSGNYIINATGFGTGYLYENVKSSGIVNKVVSGYASYLNSTIVPFNVNFFTGTGVGFDIDGTQLLITGEAISGSGLATLRYQGGLTGINIPSEYLMQKTFTGDIGSRANQEIISNPYITSGFGYYTGIIITGEVNSDFFKNFHPGYYYFRKNSNNISGSGSYFQSIKIPILTGLESLLSNQTIPTGFIEYRLSGIITGSDSVISGFLDYCSTGSNLIRYTITGEDTGVSYFIVNNSKISNISNQLEFIYIHPTGLVEIENKNIENINYLTGNINGTGIRTRISHIGNTPNGSGYFSGLFFVPGSDISSGSWIHKFNNSTNEVEEYYSQCYNSKISVNLNIQENTYFDQDSYLIFRFTGV